MHGWAKWIIDSVGEPEIVPAKILDVFYTQSADVTAIQAPVFVANGDSDPTILPRYSHLLAGLIPDAEIEIYPDAAHGFLFQHHERFAKDVTRFLE
jgi:pimeloyl-ACP methyl ester carboxylesterase